MKCCKYLAIALVGLIILVSDCIPAANSAERGGKSTETERVNREAERAYNEALRLDPDDAYGHYNLGSLYEKTGRHEEAELAYKEALKLDPNDPDIHNNLGSLYEKTGRHEEAELAYKEALRLDPDDAYAQFNLGRLYARTGRHEDAERAYKESIRLDSNDADKHYSLGLLYENTGRVEKAERAYKEAIRLDPSHISAQATWEFFTLKRACMRRPNVNSKTASGSTRMTPIPIITLGFFMKRPGGLKRLKRLSRRRKGSTPGS